ncbi:hypothetical protein KKB83_03535 [Patescibacteria group bacterium]|nr:hypothetical protein [Patescibacteria group bacterium]
MKNQNYFLKHAFEYVLIFLIIVTAIAGLFLLETIHLKRVAVLGVALLYPLWGIIHHWESKNLTMETILEYFAFALLIVWTLLVVVV